MKEIVDFYLSHLPQVTLAICALGFATAWIMQKLIPVYQAGPQVGRQREPRRRLWACAVFMTLALWNLMALCIDFKSAQAEDSAFMESTFLIAGRYSLIAGLGYTALTGHRRLPDLSWRSGIILILGLVSAGVATVVIARL